MNYISKISLFIVVSLVISVVSHFIAKFFIAEKQNKKSYFLKQYFILQIVSFALSFNIVFINKSITITLFIFQILILILLLAIAAIDKALKIIPNKLNIILLFCVIIYIAIMGYNFNIAFGRVIAESLKGFFWGTLIMLLPFLVSLLKKERQKKNYIREEDTNSKKPQNTSDAMGMGDIKLIAICGLLLGWQKVLLALAFSFVIAAIVLLPSILFKRVDIKQTIAFGPFLVAGIIIAWLWGSQLIDFYLGLFLI